MKKTDTILTVFGQYLWENRISDAKFAVMFANHLKLPTFSKRTVEKWRYGKRIPNSINMKAIKELTGVSPDSWFQETGQEPDAADDRSG